MPGARPQTPGWQGARPAPDRTRRCADRRVSPRSDRAAGPRPGGLPRTQSPPRLRPGHRLGPRGRARHAAGHDLNYIALVGAVHAFGRRGQPPTPPLNLIGDFGGGALYLAFGVVCGILEALRSGRGQVVDAAMVDGAASLMTAFHGMMAAGLGSHDRGTNILDTGAHFYEVYECADGRWISIAAIEGKFYAELLRRLDIDPATLPPQMDREHWPEAKAQLAALFKTRTRDEWCALLEGTDACFAPVLTSNEAPRHPHNKMRGTYVEIDGID